MNTLKFKEMILSRSFINATYQDKETALPEIQSYLRSTKPYSDDKVLMSFLVKLDTNRAQFKSNESDITAFSNYHAAVGYLAEYFAVLAKNIEVLPDFIENDPLLFVRANAPIESLSYSDMRNPNKKLKFDALSKDNKTRVFKIRGDGNCYYRAVMAGFIQKAMLGNAATRQESFNYLAELIRNNLLIGGQAKYFIENEAGKAQSSLNEQGAQLVGLANFFEAAAKGEELSTFQVLWNQLDDVVFDDSLIRFSRSLLAHEVLQKVNNNDELYSPVMFGLFDDDSSVQKDYIDTVVLKMGVCAEGVPINSNLLPHAIGCDAQLNIVDREAIPKPSSPEDEPKLINEVANHVIEAGRKQFWPNNPINLLLQPGHYDLLESSDDHNLRVVKEREEALVALTPAINHQLPELQGSYHKMSDSMPSLAQKEIDFVENKVKNISPAYRQTYFAMLQMLFSKRTEIQSGIDASKAIDIDKMDKANSDENESDEDFAKRLQDAEFRASGFNK